MIQPARASVRPRVIAPETNDPILLESLVAEFEGGRGLAIVGGMGSGKSAALAHLAAVLGESRRMALLDEPSAAELAAALASGPVVVASREAGNEAMFPAYRLAPWTDDDFIEYLLAQHPQQCGAVMRRITAAADRALHEGLPELCAAVLDRMAEDDGLLTVADALRREMMDALRLPKKLRAAQRLALALVLDDEQDVKRCFKKLRKTADDDRAIKLLLHSAMRLVIAADELAMSLGSLSPTFCIGRRLPGRLVKMTGPLLSHAAIDYLQREMQLDDNPRRPMAASLLHAARPPWTPDQGREYNLAGAYLAGVQWAGLHLPNVVLSHCDLRGSDLSDVQLETAVAYKTRFARAVLAGAKMVKLQAPKADFLLADLSATNLAFATLEHADFTSAGLHRGCLHGAVLRGAVLRNAHCEGADLHMANLHDAQIEGANFAGTNFERAELADLPLRVAQLTGATFAFARMKRCDLEGVDLPAGQFHKADLREANLTSSRMPGANFSSAKLRGAKVADVLWEGADLSHADFRECVFHFGSSRSGLVGSPIAGEGSRTGFYTDEFDQQSFRPAEEIRVADLRGADLRGADLTGTDFYLVDLRGAKYTAGQHEHLRRCGAILADQRP